MVSIKPEPDVDEVKLEESNEEHNYGLSINSSKSNNCTCTNCSKDVSCEPVLDSKSQIKIESFDIVSKQESDFSETLEDKSIDLPTLLFKKKLGVNILPSQLSQLEDSYCSKVTELTQASSGISSDKKEIVDESENSDFDIELYNEPFIAETDSECEEEIYSQQNIKQNLISGQIKGQICNIKCENYNNNCISEENIGFSKDLKIWLKDCLIDWKTGSKVILKRLNVVLNRMIIDAEIAEYSKNTISTERRKLDKTNTKTMKIRSKSRKQWKIEFNGKEACRVCFYKSQDDDVLRRHEDLHDDHTPNIRQWKCLECNYKARCRHHVKMHVHKIHIIGKASGVKMYKCDQCDYKSRVKGNVTHHLLSHVALDEVETYRCSKCRYVTKYKPSLKYHMKKHRFDGVFLYECQKCVFGTNNKRRLDVHALGHNELEPQNREPVVIGDKEEYYHKCNVCAYQTKFWSNFVRHKYTHLTHNKNTGEYECEKCPFTVRLKHVFITHLKQAHKVPYAPKIHKCDYCPYQTKAISDFRRHYGRHKDADEVQLYHCAHCLYETKIKYNMVLHQRRVHRPHQMEMYKCDRCDFETRYKNHIPMHVKIVHEKNFEGLKFHRCADCPFKSRLVTNVTKHKRDVHATGKDVLWYKCGKCDFRTRHNGVLVSHTRRLHQRRWYACPNCAYNTGSCSSYQAHKNEHRNRKKL